jgi:two-component system, cell cycle response regulator
LLDYLLSDFRRGFQLDAVTLFLLDPEETARELLEAGSGDMVLPGLHLVRSQRLLREIHPNDELHCGELHDAHRGTCFAEYPNVISAALLPLIREDCLIGSLALGSRDRQRFSDHLSYDYVSHLASVVSLCIESCISRETLQRLSSTDALTRVLNRRALNSQLIGEIKRSSRTGEPLAFLLLDIDHFKQVNDRNGHLTGDRILRAVGRVLAERVRATDIVARYGGEEFAILLPGCDLPEALHVAETLRTAISDIGFLGHEGQIVRVTVSFGVTVCEQQHAQVRDPMAVAEGLTHSADQALYRSKRQGRNRTNSQPLCLPNAVVITA